VREEVSFQLFVESVSGVEMSELEVGWRILAGKDFLRKGAAERVERLDYNSSLFARYEGLLC